MSRSGYSEDYEYMGLYRESVRRAFCGKRGQAFFQEMASALDAMPMKRLITGDLVNEDGACCAIGSVALARGLDVSELFPSNHEDVSGVFGIARCMSAEIAYENDEGIWGDETPAERWQRMRDWVAKQINQDDQKRSE